ncbi:hypothetical protein [Canibacter oris]|uniref:Uncharacterized protein n=1 Tax=Canibacter oris TaxID=1365628 RepID=A0A840DE46_9MICO|nr:hypothetical protein [Canibacter oris]MBB4071721.1 hypothetical protein [Canibacter oris]
MAGIVVNLPIALLNSETFCGLSTAARAALMQAMLVTMRAETDGTTNVTQIRRTMPLDEQTAADIRQGLAELEQVGYVRLDGDTVTFPRWLDPLTEGGLGQTAMEKIRVNRKNATNRQRNKRAREKQELEKGRQLQAAVDNGQLVRAEHQQSVTGGVTRDSRVSQIKSNQIKSNLNQIQRGDDEKIKTNNQLTNEQAEHYRQAITSTSDLNTLHDLEGELHELGVLDADHYPGGGSWQALINVRGQNLTRSGFGGG